MSQSELPNASDTMKVLPSVLLVSGACIALVMLVLLKSRSPHSEVGDGATLACHDKAIDALLGGPAITMSLKNEDVLRDRLRKADSKMLQILMTELKVIPILETEGRKDTWQRTRRIRKAFELLGTNGEPLIPELTKQFRTGCNPGDMAWALLGVGKEGWPGLVLELTNSSPAIRNSSIHAVGYMDSSNGIAVLQQLLNSLTNGPSVSRSITALSLGRLPVNSRLVLPGLSRSAEADEDPVVRLQSVKAIAIIGERDTNVVAVLQQLIDVSKDEDVRQSARLAVRRLLK